MTTIVADTYAGVMASDSQWTDGTEVGERKKIYRLNRGLIGLAGDLTAVEEWLTAYRRKDEQIRVAGKLVVLRLDSLGIHVWTPADDWVRMHEKRYAVGTGGMAARAAMMHGASAAEAVRTACQLDAGSGGRVRVYRL